MSDLRPGRLNFLHSRYRHLQLTTDANEILDDSQIDAVVISTPPATHRDLAVAALNAGKHVLVEKPLAMSTRDAEEIVACAQRNHRTVAVGHLFLYAPAVVAIRKMLQSGSLGDLYYISSTRANLGPPNTVVDVLWDLAPHDVSIVLDFMGDVPSKISAEAACFSGSGFAETAFITLHFPGNRIAHIHVSWLTPNKTRVMQVVCSERVVVYDDTQPVQKVQVYDAGIDNRVNARPGDAQALAYAPGTIVVPALPAEEPLQAECMDFVRSIAACRPALSSGERAVEVVRVLAEASKMIQREASNAAPPAYAR